MLPLVLNPVNLKAGLAGRGRRATAGRPCWPRRGWRRGCCPKRSPDALLAPLQLLFVAGLPEGEARDLAARARGLGVLVNVEDVLPLCDFHVPAIVRRGELLLTASTGGQVPGLARALRESLADAVRPGMDGAAEGAGRGPRQMARRRACRPREVSEKVREHDRADGLAMSPTSVTSPSSMPGAACGRTPAPDAEIAAHLAALQDKAAGRDAHGILELALTGEFAGKTAVVSSFGAESRGAAASWWREIDPNTPILFLNTGKLFGETLRYRDRLQDVLGLGDVRSLAPSLDDARPPRSRRHAVVAAIPMPAAISARPCRWPGRWSRSRPRSRAASASRPASAPTCSRWNFSRAAIRFNPLWQWDLQQLEAFAERHKLPRHPLVEDGYPSIGCMPCTRRVQAGEDYRAGRWSGLDKDECGIHLTDGGGI